MTGSWPQKARQSLKFSSSVDLEGEHIDDLSRLGSLKMMRQLSLSYVHVTSIAGLKPQPHLETFIADGSHISSLTNFIAIESVRKVSLRNTPVVQQPQFVLSVLLVCPSLTSLNGKQIPPVTRERAELYPRIGRQLVNAGWFAEFPYPTQEQLAELAVNYELVTPKRSLEEEDVAEPAPEIDRFDAILANFWKQQEHLVRTVKMRCGFPVSGYVDDDDQEEEPVAEQGGIDYSSDESQGSMDGGDQTEMTLLAKLAAVLREYNVQLDEENLFDSVVEVIDQLCVEGNEQKRPIDDT
jgi:hypothetical protein